MESVDGPTPSRTPCPRHRDSCTITAASRWTPLRAAPTIAGGSYVDHKAAIHFSAAALTMQHRIGIDRRTDSIEDFVSSTSWWLHYDSSPTINAATSGADDCWWILRGPQSSNPLIRCCSDEAASVWNRSTDRLHRGLRVLGTVIAAQSQQLHDERRDERRLRLLVDPKWTTKQQSTSPLLL